MTCWAIARVNARIDLGEAADILSEEQIVKLLETLSVQQGTQPYTSRYTTFYGHITRLEIKGITVSLTVDKTGKRTIGIEGVGRIPSEVESLKTLIDQLLTRSANQIKQARVIEAFKRVATVNSVEQANAGSVVLDITL